MTDLSKVRSYHCPQHKAATMKTKMIPRCMITGALALSLAGATSASTEGTDDASAAAYKDGWAEGANGSTSGGAFGGWTWKPETVKSEEAGFKAQLFDRKLRVALTLYNAKYNDVQGIVSGTTIQANLNNQAHCTTNVPVGTVCPGDKFATLGSTIANSFNMRSRGFEFEADAAPVRGLTLGLGVGFSDSKILKTNPLFITNPPFPLDLYFRSKWTMNANIGYDTPPLFGEAFLRFRVDANYRS